MYDYLIVGAGLFGAVCARELTAKGKKCLVIDKRPNIGGNVFTEEVEGILVHKYGAHIFHTSNRKVWDYVQRFADFNNFVNSPVANFHGKLYNLPFNMNTFYQLWGTITPEEARAKIESQRVPVQNPRNVEEQALALVGRDVYETLVKDYTEKQWGRPCAELPAFILKRLPLRFVYDNNYYSDSWQGIPIEGYTAMVNKMLDGIETKVATPFEMQLAGLAERVIYTGPIDEYFGFCYGPLEYRTLRFEREVLDKPNAQGLAVVNYTSWDEAFTRIIEHKHFAAGAADLGPGAKTVVTREYSDAWRVGAEPYYPVNNELNDALYKRYAGLAVKDPKFIFAGRLGSYRYLDMDRVIGEALDLASR